MLSLMFEKSGVPMSERIRMTQDPGAQSSPILLVPKPRGRLIVKQGLEVPEVDHSASATRSRI